MVEAEKLIGIVKGTKTFFENRAAAGNIRVKGRADYATQVDDSVQKYLYREFQNLYPEIKFMSVLFSVKLKFIVPILPL